MALRTQVIPGGEMLLSFEERIEPSDAPALREVLGAASGWRLVLDFGRLSHIEDYSLAILAPEILAAEASDVRLRGLGHHHLRLLQYLGLGRSSPGADGPEALA